MIKYMLFRAVFCLQELLAFQFLLYLEITYAYWIMGLFLHLQCHGYLLYNLFPFIIMQGSLLLKHACFLQFRKIFDPLKLSSLNLNMRKRRCEQVSSGQFLIMPSLHFPSCETKKKPLSPFVDSCNKEKQSNTAIQSKVQVTRCRKNPESLFHLT